MSDDSEVKIHDKIIKYRWMDVQRNDYITLKKKILIKRSERKEKVFSSSFVDNESS